jgi:nucleotide-binding universal stress UspA family protein
MASYEKIFCPVDFSEVSRQALLDAAELARREEASLTVLHVRDDPTGTGRPLESETAEEFAALEALRGEAEWIRGDRVGAVVLSGPVASSIAQFASDTGADLIVMGSHGRTGIQRWSLGSVAEAVLRQAPCPVLVVHASRGKQGEAPTALTVAHP